MNVSRDVVKDLLTVYLAGEASADTRAFVEAYLKTDPALAADVEAARGASLALPPPRLPTAEKRTLDAARQQLRLRTTTMALAILFTVLPLTFAFRGTTLTFLLMRDAPVLGLVWWAIAAAMWMWHVRIRRRLQTLGV